MYRPNPLKQRLRDGGQVVGAWAGLPDPAVIEILALAGFDFVIIDQEHGPGTMGDLGNLLRACTGTGCAPVLRVGRADNGLIKQALDLGVEGLMIPDVRSAAEAAELVAMCRYPPKGRRGMAPGAARGASYGMAVQEYVDTFDENFVLMPQIESGAAAAEAAAIAAVDGVDVVFVGAMDLAGDLGHTMETGHRHVIETVDGIQKAAAAAGAWTGTVPHGERGVSELVADGWDVIAGFVDVMQLRDAALAHVSAFRKEATAKGR